MNKLDYHDFYNSIWEHENLNDIISMRFMDEESEFIKNYTFELYRQYELREDVSINFIRKLVEITFGNLAIFEPKIFKIKPIPDNGNVVF